MVSRRQFLKHAGYATGTALLQPYATWAADLGPPTLPAGALESAVLGSLPGKRPLIKRSYRPPNYETPIEYFNEAITPNDAFFVRYHLSNIPAIDPQSWRLSIGGEAAEAPYELTLDELRRFKPVELTAVCLCSGNRRGLFDPHVAGVEWGYGAMGNASWKGVRLRDLLQRAKPKKETVEVAFDGADSGVIPATPDFVKSVPAWKAMNEDTLVAYEMNGSALPHWNGFPVRLVLPGWTGTYWMKHLVAVQMLSRPLQNFWMNAAYRIPLGKFPLIDRFITQETDSNTPITEMVVNSLITSPGDGQSVRAGTAVEVKGLAWDGGYGMRMVEVSIDGGRTWYQAELGRDLGRYSFREWRYRFTPAQRGQVPISAKATNSRGGTQTFELIFNPSGYHHNVVQQINL
ncbi:MAG: molybdopterin-dependent oxidoreductase, partial [Burkholderiales bacterium]